MIRRNDRLRRGFINDEPIPKAIATHENRGINYTQLRRALHRQVRVDDARARARGGHRRRAHGVVDVVAVLPRERELRGVGAGVGAAERADGAGDVPGPGGRHDQLVDVVQRLDHGVRVEVVCEERGVDEGVVVWVGRGEGDRAACVCPYV